MSQSSVRRVFLSKKVAEQYLNSISQVAVPEVRVTASQDRVEAVLGDDQELATAYTTGRLGYRVEGAVMAFAGDFDTLMRVYALASKAGLETEVHG